MYPRPLVARGLGTKQATAAAADGGYVSDTPDAHMARMEDAGIADNVQTILQQILFASMPHRVHNLKPFVGAIMNGIHVGEVHCCLVGKS